jgi:predicted SnoaL-like aldol condensation-catalyzing enzyme
MQQNRLTAILAISFIALLVSCNQATTEQTSTGAPAKKEEDKKAQVVKSLYPLWEKGDWISIEKMVSADFTDHNPWVSAAGVSGRDSLIQSLKEFKEAFPTMRFDVLHTAVDGDMVFVHYHFTGSNDGPFMGMPATNKKLDYMGVDLIRVKDSVATEHWDYGDNITHLKQMGLMP